MAKQKTKAPAVRTAIVKKATTPTFDSGKFAVWYAEFQETLRAQGKRNGDIMALKPEDQHKNFQSGLTPLQATEC